MIEYINTHQHGFWFFIGFALLAIEAFALGLSTGVVLFAGLGSLITGGLMLAGIIPSTWLAGIASFGISSGISAALLWKMLVKFQNFHPPGKDNSSDLIGHQFRLEQTITSAEPGQVKYSGIQWRVEIAQEAACEQIDAGQWVEVVTVDAGIFRVKSKEASSGTNAG